MTRAPRAPLGALLALLAGCQAAPPPPAPNFALPPALRAAAFTPRDWAGSRYAGPGIDALRRAASPPAARRLLAFGDTPGWTNGGQAGLPLSAFGATGVAVNAPAWADRGPDARLMGRVWFLTSTGRLLGVHRDDPLNTADPDKRAIAIDLGHAVTRGAITLSPDCTRAYVVADDGTLCAADLATGTVTAIALGGPAVGVGVCVDPVLSAASGGPDHLFTATNDGTAIRLRWAGGVLTEVGRTRGVAGTRAVDGTTTMLAAAPVAWGGVAYYGDRAGRLHQLDWRGATPVLTTTAIPGAGPIEAAVALRLDADNAVQDVFASAGARMAWLRLPADGRPGFTALSPMLVIDGAPGAANEGALAAYPLRGTRVAARPADEALTALDGPAGGVLPGQGAARAVRTASVGAAHVVDPAAAALAAVYGQPGTAVTPVAEADVRAGAAAAAGFATPLGLAVGPDGEVYLGGKQAAAGAEAAAGGLANEGATVWVVPAKAMTNRWGWAALEAGKSYPIAGPGAPGGAPAPALREPHAVWHDDRGTADRADDRLWFAEWRGNAVRRVEPDGQVTLVAGNGGGGHTHHTGAAPWGARTPLGRPEGICVATAGVDAGAAFVAEADHPHVLRLDPGTGQMTVAVELPAAASAVCHDVRTDALYVASQAGHRVWRYDLATRTLTAIAGTGQAGHDADGAPALASRLHGPTAVAVHPTTGEVYVGEGEGDGAAGRPGCRIKVVRGGAADPQAGTLWTHAGDGGLVPAAGPATATGIGRVAGLAFGPLDLAAAGGDRAAALYATSRDAHAVLRLATPATSPGRALGLLQWRLGDAFAGRSFLEAAIRLVAADAPAGDPARPEVQLAGTAYGDGAPGPWTAAGLAPGKLPALDATAVAAYDGGTGPADPVAWRAGDRHGWTLPAERLPTGGTLALGLVPPADTKAHHFAHGGGYAPGAGTATAIDFHGTADPALAPTLDAFVSDFKLAGGLASPPTLGADTGSPFVYAVNANAVFRLDATDPATFAGEVRYAATRLGRRVDGPLDRTATPATFVTNPVSPLVTLTNRVYTLDLRKAGATWDFGVNRMNGSAAAGAMLTHQLALDGKSASAQTYRAGTFLVSDGFGNDFGYLYFGLGDGRVYRVGL